MRLLEYQAKEIFKRYGIPVPQSFLIESETDLLPVCLPVVLKAQVLTGGRGKAGAIKVVETTQSAMETFRQLMGMKVKNEIVHAVLAEQKKPIQKEFYLSLLIDKVNAMPMFVACSEGGMDIEQVSKETPQKIIKLRIDPFVGLQTYDIRKIANLFSVSEKEIAPIMRGMMAIYQENDATLVEINPLALVDGHLIALDAKMVLDDKAEFRHAGLFSPLKERQAIMDKASLSPSQLLAREWEITYVPLEGDLGLVSDGAGTGMLTLDLIKDAGGHAANFCELGGLANADRMNKSLNILALNSQIKVVMVSLIGGLTRMDDMAEGIATYLSNHPDRFKLAVRMCGTKAAEGQAILASNGVAYGEDLFEVVGKAVALAQEAAK